MLLMMMRQGDEDETMMQQCDDDESMTWQQEDDKMMSCQVSWHHNSTNKQVQERQWMKPTASQWFYASLGGLSWTSKDAVGPHQLGQEQHDHHKPLCWIPLLLEWSGILCIVLHIILKNDNMIHVELLPTNTQRLPWLPVCPESIQLCNHCWQQQLQNPSSQLPSWMLDGCHLRWWGWICWKQRLF